MTSATQNMEAFTAAAASLSEGSGAETLVSLKETTSWSNRLTEQYVAQAAMAAAAGGFEGATSCGRGLNGTHDSHFAIVTAAEDSPNQARRLLSAGGGASTGQEPSWQTWDGYSIGTRREGTNAGGWGLEAQGMDTPERARWLGGSGRNRLVGGLFLHTTRKAVGLTCSTGSKWAMGCSRSTVPLAEVSSKNAVLAFLKQLFAGAGDLIHPYGVDPVFLRSSSLYNPDLVGREGQWYNISDPSEVPPTTGVPYGYYHRPLKVSKLIQIHPN
jgi:hypothetical protein